MSIPEIMTGVSIAAVIAALGIPIYNSVLQDARMARELGAARKLITAWHSYAGDNNGSVLPGFQTTPAYNQDGELLSYPVNARYPFRIAPYLGHELKGAVLVNDQEKFLLEKDPEVRDYSISVFPSFGINATFVGGDYGSGSELQPSESTYSRFGKFVITHITEPVAPQKLIVFASAHSDSSHGKSDGYFLIRSPRLQADRWADSYDPNASASQFGYVHPRYNGRAVAAMADGHVELLDESQLRDMRRWSNQAAEANNPNWTLKRL